jgi:glutamate formiminotransferase
VINVSEGRRTDVVEAVAAAARPCLLDVHTDAHHHRSVLTLAGDPSSVLEAARRVAAETVRTVDLRTHTGAHPRLGAVDVVPFVPLVDATMADALAARDGFAAWAGTALQVPCFLYGPERTLPEVRKSAFAPLVPDTGPAAAHPAAGAICVGARPVLVAFNVWLAPGAGVDTARRIAAAVRRPEVRALGLDVGGRAQVSMNLVEPLRFGPAEAYDAVAALAGVDRAELVGLVPSAVLEAVPTRRWAELDLSASRTIEARAGGGGFRPSSG